MRRLFAQLAGLIDMLRTAPGCGGNCAGGRRPCNCRPAAPRTAPGVTRGPARCVGCRLPLGAAHAAGCRFAPFTIRRAQ